MISTDEILDDEESALEEPVLPRHVVFADANALLFLYEYYDPMILDVVEKLGKVGDSLFVPMQIVEEVERNKLKVADRTLRNTLDKLKVPKVNLPAGLREHATALDAAIDQLQECRTEVERAARDRLGAISNSEDEVSVGLRDLFQRAVGPSSVVVSRARERKERGNPPGKHSGALGDQICWEQLLEVIADGCSVLWIITGDQDYYVRGLGKKEHLLNPLLRQDVLRRAPGCEVRVFRKEDLVGGINDFFDASRRAQDKFTEEQRIYLQRLREEREYARQPWECARDLELTPIISIECPECECVLEEGIWSESYAVERVRGGLRLVIEPDIRDLFQISCTGDSDRKMGSTIRRDHEHRSHRSTDHGP